MSTREILLLPCHYQLITVRLFTKVKEAILMVVVSLLGMMDWRAARVELWWSVRDGWRAARMELCWSVLDGLESSLDGVVVVGP